MHTEELRRIFLEFFQTKQHEIVSSSPLVPGNDPTLLFTNAGMVQFKEVFLGEEKREYLRAASSQKCLRAGGKHNDLENVGFTARHHTFFEMLGNFSFGDYFKLEAIEYAWEFVTKVLKLPPELLWVTVYEADQEAEEIWIKQIGVDPNRLSRCGEKDNFWSMGDTGPCGPCSEIFYDHGPDISGGPPGSVAEDGDRYVEIWNLVFMQYNRDSSGKLTPLPKPSVDTGMGLERVAAIMQQVHSNYEIDLFQKLIQATAKLLKVETLTHKSLRVITDHLRACTFLVADGVLPANDGRGYVLRRIMRRAIRHGKKLGGQELFFHKLVKNVIIEMGGAFPYLITAQAQIEKVFKQEEIQFGKTLEQGLKLLENIFAVTKDGIVSGEDVFHLHDTYGFPTDLTADIARERGMQLDMLGFEKAMHRQKARSREASKFDLVEGKINITSASRFVGYDTDETKGKILELLQGEHCVEKLGKGDNDTIIVVDQTPFYAESGGQVGDKGYIKLDQNIFEVLDTQKISNAYVHYGRVVAGQFLLGDQVKLTVDTNKRQAIRLNHSATHLLHAALKQILGTHVQQKGSVVDAERLRFDFSHFSALTNTEIQEIESLINVHIRANSIIKTEEMSITEAQKSGAVALFGEKYGTKVRVLSMGGGFSIELCGGTHAARTGDLGFFKIISEAASAAGVRRIEAITGKVVVEWLHNQDVMLQRTGSLLKVMPKQIENKVQQLVDNVKLLEKQNLKLQEELANSKWQDLLAHVQERKGINVLSAILPGATVKSLREAVDRCKNKLGSAIVVLGAVQDHKVNLIAGVSKNCAEKIQAGSLVNYVAAQVGGKGGGRPDMAQAGGNQPENLQQALDSVYTWVDAQL